MDDVQDTRTIAWKLRQIRKSRRKSLTVIAELAGMSQSRLSRIERGEVALDGLSDIVALANALQIAPSELMRMSVPALVNGHTDGTIEAIRLALDAIDAGHPAGIVLPVSVLRDQVIGVHAQMRACQFSEVASVLPGLIHNMHTALISEVDHAELLDLAVYLHVHVTRMWLARADAPTDLKRRAVFLARRLSRERNEVTILALAEYAVIDTLLAGGALELGQVKLDSIVLPPATAATAGLIGCITVQYATVAALDRRYGDMAAPMTAAMEIAERFGATREIDSLGFWFGPANVGLSRMWQALESHEPDQTARIAQEFDPQRIPFAIARALYWTHQGRALAKLQGRQDEAVMALRIAEKIFPTMVLRDPMVREVLAELVLRARRDAIGRELRGLAYRAGIPV